MTFVDVEIVRVPLRQLTERLWERPFEESPEFTRGWWTGLARSTERVYYSGRVDGVEVARVELDLSATISDTFRTVTNPHEGFIEVPFFEVAVRRRCQGIGHAVISALMELYPERRFAAFSENADKFWAGLGWSRHEHEEGTRLHRPLYLS